MYDQINYVNEELMSARNNKGNRRSNRPTMAAASLESHTKEKKNGTKHAAAGKLSSLAIAAITVLLRVFGCVEPSSVTFEISRSGWDEGVRALEVVLADCRYNRKRQST